MFLQVSHQDFSLPGSTYCSNSTAIKPAFLCSSIIGRKTSVLVNPLQQVRDTKAALTAFSLLLPYQQVPDKNTIPSNIIYPWGPERIWDKSCQTLSSAKPAMGELSRLHPFALPTYRLQRNHTEICPYEIIRGGGGRRPGTTHYYLPLQKCFRATCHVVQSPTHSRDETAASRQQHRAETRARKKKNVFLAGGW